MYIKVKEIKMVPNNDGTYKVEIPNIDITDIDGSVIKGTVTFPRVKSNLIENDDGEINIDLLCELETVGDTMFTIEI